jgi:pyruvate dehydrogenase E2 component (dihydrolipoyllysine-residue acetyltransferase)
MVGLTHPRKTKEGQSIVANATEVLVPDIGDFKDVDVIEVLVAAGDQINADDPLVTLESDKATMDVPSPHAGVIKDVKIKVGDKVSKGAPILTLELAAAAQASTPAAAATASPPSAPAQLQATTKVEAPVVTGVSQSSVAGAAEVVEVRVPDIGDFKEVDVIGVTVATGDKVNAEDPLITLESDKATMDVPAPFAGVVRELKIKIGDKVSEGSLILTLQRGETGVASERPAEPTEPPKPAAATPPPSPPMPEQARPASSPTAALAAEIDESAFRKAHASPTVRRFARELGVDLAGVSGTGPKGRIIKEDVQAYVKGALAQPGMGVAAARFALPEMPAIDFSKFGATELQPLSRIKKISGPHLHRSWVGIPHVTQHDEADITELEQFRQQLKEEAQSRNVRVTLIAFLMKASVAALKQFPQFNASLDAKGENLILKKYYHIGIAVDTPEGLVVPVIRDVDRKGIFDLAAELGSLSSKARDKKLTPTDLQGGCFSISSLGGIGGTAFTPIINAPEVAILGVSRSRMQPVYLGDAFVPRLILPLSLSYDHRVIDGAQAARFTTYLGQILADVRRLLL